MGFILFVIWIIIIFLIVFLYLLRKDDWSDLSDETEKDIILSEKKSKLDWSIFYEGLSSFQINNDKFLEIKKEIWKQIIWLDEFLNALLVSLFSQGHMLVEWVPWLAKTKTIIALSSVLDFKNSRIQFTPDMMPWDIVWIEIFNSKLNDFEVKRGPIFSNIILADEINRTTPKVQSALLEAMQEKQVTIWWNTFVLDKPFFVLATQNPIEQEWTYQLPEAQLDRFLFKTVVSYPDLNSEKEILKTIEAEDDTLLQKILSKEDFYKILIDIEKVTISDDIIDYIARLVIETRKSDERIYFWASPRASISFYKASKVLAYMSWRDYVVHSDIQKLALLILRHRVVLTYDAKVDWLNIDDVIVDILSKVNLE